MTALVTTKTDPIGLADVTASGGVRYLGAAINNFWNDIPDRIVGATAASLNTIRIFDILTSNKNITDTYNDSTAWALVDSAIAQAATAGLMVILDLSTYRNWLAKHANVNPYTADWSAFVTFVANRVNTVSGLVYKDDPTIEILSIAGEPSPGGETNGSGTLMPTTSAQLVSFYGTVAGLLHSAFPHKLISSGGLLHYRAGSVGDTAWVDWQGIFSAVKSAAPSYAVAAVHVYSGIDFGGAPGSGDEAQLAGVASYCTGNNLPWILEEFGLIQNQGQGNWSNNDALRAKRFTAIMALGYANGATGILFWNDGTELYFDTADALGSYPATNLSSGSVQAYSALTNYVTGDAASNGGTSWYCIVPNGPGTSVKTPNDTNSQFWGKLKTSTFDVGPSTPLTFAAIRKFVPGALFQARSRLVRFAGGTGESISFLASEALSVDDSGTIYVDENGVAYTVGA